MPRHEETAHTRGSWWLEFDTIGLELADHIAVSGPNHQALALVVWRFEDGEHMPQVQARCRANAHLIAASPDLLKALRAMVECEFGTDAALKATQRARALIKKLEKPDGSHITPA